MKIYEIGLLMNARDLGGYKTKRGKVTKFGSFIRSDAPHYLTPEEVSQLYSLGVRHTIDIRTAPVAEKYVSPFRTDPRFRYYNFPVSEGEPSRWHIDEEWPGTYLGMVDNPESFYGIFKTMADADGTVFYHCSAGKDRTGIVTFLLLSLVGVSERTIVGDYALSAQLIDRNIHKVREKYPAFPESLGISPPRYMKEFIRLFKEKYRSAEHFLISVGLTEDDIKKIKSKLV